MEQVPSSQSSTGAALPELNPIEQKVLRCFECALTQPDSADGVRRAKLSRCTGLGEWAIRRALSPYRRDGLLKYTGMIGAMGWEVPTAKAEGIINPSEQADCPELALQREFSGRGPRKSILRCMLCIQDKLIDAGKEEAIDPLTIVKCKGFTLQYIEKEFVALVKLGVAIDASKDGERNRFRLTQNGLKHIASLVPQKEWEACAARPSEVSVGQDPPLPKEKGFAKEQVRRCASCILAQQEIDPKNAPQLTAPNIQLCAGFGRKAVKGPIDDLLDQGAIEKAPSSHGVGLARGRLQVYAPTATQDQLVPRLQKDCMLPQKVVEHTLSLLTPLQRRALECIFWLIAMNRSVTQPAIRDGISAAEGNIRHTFREFVGVGFLEHNDDHPRIYSLRPQGVKLRNEVELQRPLSVRALGSKGLRALSCIACVYRKLVKTERQNGINIPIVNHCHGARTAYRVLPAMAQDGLFTVQGGLGRHGKSYEPTPAGKELLDTIPSPEVINFCAAERPSGEWQPKLPPVKRKPRKRPTRQPSQEQSTPFEQVTPSKESPPPLEPYAERLVRKLYGDIESKQLEVLQKGLALLLQQNLLAPSNLYRLSSESPQAKIARSRGTYDQETGNFFVPAPVLHQYTLMERRAVMHVLGFERLVFGRSYKTEDLRRALAIPANLSLIDYIETNIFEGVKKLREAYTRSAP